MARLHEFANAAALSAPHKILKAPLASLVKLVWPLLCACLIWGVRDVELPCAAADAGLSLRAYRLRQWRSCVKLRIPPEDYLLFSFHRPERCKEAGTFVLDIENHFLIGALNRNVNIDRLEDKFAFWRHCLGANLPSIPVLMSADGGIVRHALAFDDPIWHCDLIAKPASANSGRGVVLFKYVGPDQYKIGGSRHLRLRELIGYLTHRSQRESYIVQPRVKNSMVMAPFTQGALATVRVLTGKYASGQIAAVASFLRMPVGNAIVDNFAAGGILANIDLATGQLSHGLKKSDRWTLIPEHPDTGIRFSGMTVPDFEGLIQLASRAHATLSDLTFISWDLALTEIGPLIVEANHHGILAEYQGINGSPLGNTQFADILLSNRAPLPCH